MATLAAIRCNPIIKAFAERLRAKGKKAKVVIVACMRKLIILINAMIRDGLEWNQLNLMKNLAHNHLTFNTAALRSTFPRRQT